jgi:hypothetical protein
VSDHTADQQQEAHEDEGLEQQLGDRISDLPWFDRGQKRCGLLRCPSVCVACLHAPTTNRSRASVAANGRTAPAGHGAG